MDTCFSCQGNAAVDLPSREQVVRTEHWRVAHAFNTSLPGWLVLVTTTHVTRMDELSEPALVELGLLLGRLSRALRDVGGAEKTYVMQFSEAHGFAHLHVHLVPKLPHVAGDLVGPGVLALLGVPDEDRVPTELMDRLADQVRAVLSD